MVGDGNDIFFAWSGKNAKNVMLIIKNYYSQHHGRYLGRMGIQSTPIIEFKNASEFSENVKVKMYPSWRIARE